MLNANTGPAPGCVSSASFRCLRVTTPRSSTAIPIAASRTDGGVFGLATSRSRARTSLSGGKRSPVRLSSSVAALSTSDTSCVDTGSTWTFRRWMSDAEVPYFSASLLKLSRLGWASSAASWSRCSCDKTVLALGNGRPRRRTGASVAIRLAVRYVDLPVLLEPSPFTVHAYGRLERAASEGFTEAFPEHALTALVHAMGLIPCALPSALTGMSAIVGRSEMATNGSQSMKRRLS